MARQPRQEPAGNTGPEPLVLAHHHGMLAHLTCHATKRQRARTQRTFPRISLRHERSGHDPGPIATWIQGDTTHVYAFDPGTLPPGAQSLGEQESIVSHTNPRVSHAAGTTLNRLVQLIWTELTQEEPSQHARGGEPPLCDNDMQVDNEGGRDDADITTGSAPVEGASHSQGDTVSPEGGTQQLQHRPSHDPTRPWRNPGHQ